MQNLKGTAAEGQVSYADLIALGGAYAVSITGGPTIDVPIGKSGRTVAYILGGKRPAKARAALKRMSTRFLHCHHAEQGLPFRGKSCN